jgi:hypothetical protein
MRLFFAALPIVIALGYLGYLQFDVLPVKDSKNKFLIEVSDLYKSVTKASIYGKTCKLWKDDLKAANNFQKNAKRIARTYFKLLRKNFPDAGEMKIHNHQKKIILRQATYALFQEKEFDCTNRQSESSRQYFRLSSMSDTDMFSQLEH